MSMDQPMLNVYEVTDEETGRPRHLVGFLDPVLAASTGLVSHAIVGEFEPGPDGEFDPDTFAVNPEFVEAVVQFLGHQPAHLPELTEGAKSIPSQRLYVVDPRNQTPTDDDPPAADLIGWYEVDEAGDVVAGSFTYNPEHVFFSRENGVSGLLLDRAFYEFLHPGARPEAGNLTDMAIEEGP